MIDKRLPFPRSELGRSGLTSRDFGQIITNLFSRQRLEWLHPAAPLYSRPIRASATAGQVEGGGRWSGEFEGEGRWASFATRSLSLVHGRMF